MKASSPSVAPINALTWAVCAFTAFALFRCPNWKPTSSMNRTSGSLIGGNRSFSPDSSKAAVASAINIAAELNEGVVVTVLPDDGSKYVSLGIFD